MIAVTEMINLLIKNIWYSHETTGSPSIRSKKNGASTISKPTVIRIKKIADYEVALKIMKSPFDGSTVP